MTVALREARTDDCERVWEWNFAPEVRAMSRDPRVVTFTEHQKWYQRRLANVDAFTWIVEEHGVAAGVVRLDLLRDGSARISIALGHRARGRGLGRQAIAAACSAWGRPVLAEIRSENAASRACFTAARFECLGESDGLATYRWSP